MSIYCRICNQEFSKLITSTHLKKHNMLTKDYVDLYGKESLSSKEYRAEKSIKSLGKNNPNFGNKMSTESKSHISRLNKGRTAWNKGLKFDDTTVQQNAVRKREEKYNSGELQRQTTIMTEEIRQKISLGVSLYAKNNPNEIIERSLKAIQTKKDNGHDLAFFRNKSHSDETKLKISENSKKHAKIKNEESMNLMKERLLKLGFDTIGDTDSTLTARCTKCHTEITYTKQVFQPSKLRSDLCWTCNPRITNKSKSELEIFEFINSKIHAISGYKYHHNKEIDIYIPDRNIGIEFNGLYWHSEQVLESLGQSKLKDFEKLKEINQLGIKLITIFEDEWVNKKEIVKSRLLRILGLDNSPKINARECEVKEINSKTATEFCNKFHLQGAGRSNIRYGLFFKQELVAVMTFSKSNISRKINEWELNRFCISSYNIPGAASKLFSYFTKNNDVDKIVTFADRRWSDGGVYNILGFKFDKFSSPGYWYLKDNLCKRIHRYSLKKTKSDDKDKTEKELRLEEGYKRIWDHGNSKWIWTR